MGFLYGKQDWKTFERGEENCWLMTNGLGGFSSLTVLGSMSRNDHAVLMSCQREEAPNRRYNMIHGLEETLTVGGRRIFLSSQEFAGTGKRQEGYRFLSRFSYEDYPRWNYLAEGVEVEKKILLLPGGNTVGIAYRIANRSGETAVFEVKPLLQFVPKGRQPQAGQVFVTDTQKRCICSEGKFLYYQTDGVFQALPARPCRELYYAYDACDGRGQTGWAWVNHSVSFSVEAGEVLTGELVYSTDGPVEATAAQIQERLTAYRQELTRQAGFAGETPRALVKAADQFVAYRASTGKQTILAGFPFFEDWGRDTMIAVAGCCLSTGQYERGREILGTFMQYVRRGLMPNLFPEGGREPQYNTADASLLFLLAVYGYFRRTGDLDFARECYPVMTDIVDWYRRGTDFGIRMDEDGLLLAGQGLDQVTWMDVRVGDILPTPRHGKPVEINAYWYNALRILEEWQERFGAPAGGEGTDYGKLADQVRESFREKFWNEKENCLKDVVSGEASDFQVRCNQIWAVAQPFSLLEEPKERAVVETVFRRLYTPLGLRTLDPADPQFHPVYGGELVKRDLAYHQGTVWMYPLGGYYLAYLKVNGFCAEAAAWVKEQLESVTAALREGCVGQLPEIYDGLEPVSSRGCFAQAWSVGELLRVYEALERGTEAVG